jgi:hypothetical protein
LKDWFGGGRGVQEFRHFAAQFRIPGAGLIEIALAGSG